MFVLTAMILLRQVSHMIVTLVYWLRANNRYMFTTRISFFYECVCVCVGPCAHTANPVPLRIGLQPSLIVSVLGRPAVIYVHVDVAKFPPAVLCEPICHIDEQILTRRRKQDTGVSARFLSELILHLKISTKRALPYQLEVQFKIAAFTCVFHTFEKACLRTSSH